MSALVRDLWTDEDGSVGVEYALFLAVLGTGAVAGVVGAFEWMARSVVHAGRDMTGPAAPAGNGLVMSIAAK